MNCPRLEAGFRSRETHAALERRSPFSLREGKGPFPTALRPKLRLGRIVKRLVIGALLLSPSVGHVSRAEEADAAQPEERVVSQLSDLGARQYERRRAAFLEIWRRGLPALEAVQAATNSPDMQIANSARVLEKLLIMGVPPQDFAAADFQILMNPTVAGLTRLCERGRWSLAVRLLKDSDELLKQFRDPQYAGGIYLNRIAEFALQQGDVDLAWPIVRLVTVPGAEAYDGSSLNVWLAEKLELSLPADLENTVDVRGQRLLYRGHGPQALELPISEPLRRKVLTRGDCWSALTEDRNRSTLLGRRDSVARRASEAVLLEFAGDLTASETAWGELWGNGDDRDAQRSDEELQLNLIHQGQSTLPAQQMHRLLLAMIVAGHVAAVEEYFSIAEPETAFGFFVAGNDHENAFRSLKLQPDLSNFDSWLRRREILIRGDLSRNITDNFGRTAQVCNLLSGLGYSTEASRVLDMLVDVSEWKVDLWTRSGSIIGWMGRAEQRELCLQAVENHFNKMPSETQNAILASLFPEFGFVVARLAREAPNVFAEDGRPVSLVRKLEKLHAWDVEYFRARAGTNAVVDWLVRVERGLIAEQIASQDPATFIAQMSELSKLAAGCGLTELAVQFAEVDTRELGSPDRIHQLQWVEAAKLHLETGNPTAAVQRLEELRTSPGSPNDQVAFLTEVKALLLDGRYADALSVDRSRWLRPLSVTRLYRVNSYAQVVDALVKANDFANARPYAKLAYMLSDFGSLDAFWSASDLADILVEQDDYLASALVLRGVLAEALGEDSSMLAYYGRRKFFSSLRYAAQKERLHQAVANIIRNEMEQAKRNLQVAAQLQPQDIEVVVQCYPRLVEARETEFAEKLFTQYEQAMQSQLATWPRDSTALNNLAWMYAKCDRQLDEALKLAQQAVKLAPRSAVYLDTLAEVHFRRGNAPRALQLMQQCVKLDPRDPNYRQNLRRFSAALQ